MTTNADSKMNKTEIKRYLYGEMTDDERARADEDFFNDDELFFEVVNLENDLIDFYARGKFPAAELERFERSLENLPERRAKIANAVALRSFIAEEKTQEKPAVVAVKQTFGQKLAEFFAFKTPAFGYAMAGLLVLFAVSSIFLFLDSRAKNAEIARLQAEQNTNQTASQKQIELENLIADSRRREDELKSQIDGERDVSGDLTDELETERLRRERIETELERLRREKSIQPAEPPQKEQTPIIASIFLSPMTTRGGNPGAQRFAVERGTKRIVVRLILPDDAKTNERFSVRLNDKIVARDLAARIDSSGQKILQLTVSPQDLIDGTNRLNALDKDEKEIVRYDFYMSKK